MFLFFIIHLLMEPEIITVRKTGVYGPMSRFRVAIPESGDIYLLNQNNVILRFDSEGKRLGEFGGRGQGPGEFIYALRIGYRDGKVWVFDMMSQSIHLFDGNGQFLERFSHAGLGSSIMAARDGWVCRTLPNPGEGPAEIFHLDPKLEGRRTLHQWTPVWVSTQKVHKHNAKVHRINPAAEYPRVVMAPNGAFLYLAHSGPKFKITVIDVRTGVIVRNISRDLELVPFNEEWGLKKIQQSNSISRGAKGVLDAPRHFPLIRNLSVSPEGYLVVQRWTGSPDKERSFLVMDSHGNEVSLGYDAAHNHRILAFRGDLAYLTGFDDEQGEGVIFKCRKQDMERVIEKHPLPKTPKGYSVPIKF